MGVVSDSFDVVAIRKLKKRGVLVAFEESESPAHGCHLDQKQLNMVSAPNQPFLMDKLWNMAK